MSQKLLKTNSQIINFFSRTSKYADFPTLIDISDNRILSFRSQNLNIIDYFLYVDNSIIEAIPNIIKTAGFCPQTLIA